MARGTSKLSAMAVKNEKNPGRYADGNGLYLQVSPTGTKSWLFRYMIDGRAREMGLGPVSLIPLAAARVAALDARGKIHQGIDPLTERGERQQQARIEQARTMTFRQCADAYIEAHRSSWRNDKHAAQWESTLKTYADPVIGDLPVNAVDLPLVLSILEPIWHTKSETASRLRGRLETVLDWATVRKFRTGENPARWRGHLDKLLPARGKVKRVEHHAALPYAEIGTFMAKLRSREGVGPLALELTILTAARTSEVLNATWEEFSLDNALWTVPANRMKAGREHRVPLSPRAVAILTEVNKDREAGRTESSKYVFPGGRAGKPLSNMVFLQLLKRMGYVDLTTHGFRSTFRDWAAEKTAFPREVAEAALAHVVADKVEAAYLRSDLFEKRRQLMCEWEEFCRADTQSEPATRA